jgi:hypothetical protein
LQHRYQDVATFVRKFSLNYHCLATLHGKGAGIQKFYN